MDSRRDRPSGFFLWVVRIGNIIEKILEVIGGIAILVFLFAVFTDVFSRTVGHSLKSCQEIALFAFVWAIFVGSAVAVRHNTHFTIDIIVNMFDGVAKTIIELFDHLVITGFAVVLLYYGYLYSVKCLKRFSQPSGICMTVGTACMVVGAACMVYYCIEYFILSVGKTNVQECNDILKQEEK